jgi:glutamate N-acetyltransferase/amino-acid N-acetyltransferase
MAVNFPEFVSLYPIAGLKIGTASAKIKAIERDDLALFKLPAMSTCAAVFTRNAFCAAPIILAREHLKKNSPRWLLINSGNANAGTGEAGLNDARACCEAVAALAGCEATQVLPFSTGVIGTPLPVEKICAALPTAFAHLESDGWEKAARAIMTTDTLPKGESIQIVINNHRVTITGIAKGAGMIKPDMATLLVFIATDATVETGVLQTCLQQAVATSFHRITVDGDTSTNDTCLLMATGHSTLPPITSINDEAYLVLCGAISELCQRLAKKVVRDGEGATKFITIEVKQGRSQSECLKVAFAIAHSPLVKTAFFASDANWGRILAAVGSTQLADFDINAVKIFLNEVCIVENGGIAKSYREALGQQVMAKAEIYVTVLLGRSGEGGVEYSECIWTSDLSYDYVRINAEYRT